VSATKVEILVLHCDQGMGTLVKVYEQVMDEEQVTGLVLVDLGSETKTKCYATDAVDEVIKALGEMSNPHFDLIILSHQDTDHWSLLPDLQKRVLKDFGPIDVNRFVRGGARWKPGAIDAVTSWEKAFNVDVVPLPRAHTQYDNPKKTPTCLCELAGAKFRVLAVNAPISRSAEDLIRNGTSAVIAVEFAGQHVVIPGDATADTLAFIQKEVFDKWSVNPVTPCFLLGAPHHGSLRTLASNFVSKNPKLNLAQEFSKSLKAARVAASAGYLSSFHHPYRSVMELLGVDAEPERPSNVYVAYNDAAFGGARWEVVTPRRKLHTTVGSLTDPPIRKTWTFTIMATGELRIHSVDRGGQPEPDLNPLYAARPR
jgi:hypothetical protein